MRSVRSRNTEPELIVRRAATALGYRYRLHRRDLPGSPDIVFPGLRKVIFVHGCFWHGHDCKRGAREPKANADYWRTKVGRNRERDAQSLAALQEMRWEAMVLWECKTKDSDWLADELCRFLRQPS